MTPSMASSIASSATDDAVAAARTVHIRHNGGVKLPDSPEDRKVRDEALQQVAKRLVYALIPTVAVGALAVALGIPWWAVLIAAAVVLYIVLFEA
jgi:hypothetical protein